MRRLISFLVVLILTCSPTIVIGVEVWGSETDPGPAFYRFAFDGTYLGSLDPGPWGFETMLVVDDEVWASGTDPGPVLYRFAFDGTYVGTHDPEGVPGLATMAFVGDEVWGSQSGAGYGIYRFGFDGTYLGSHNPPVAPGFESLAVVPEPATLSLAAFGTLALLLRRKGRKAKIH